MSDSRLAWRPAASEMNGLGEELKSALHRRYGSIIEVTLNESDLPYLEGLRDAGLLDAATLIGGIEKYEQIELKEVWK